MTPLTPSGSGPSDKASGMEPTGKEPKLLITPEAYVLLTENLKAKNAKLLREREELIVALEKMKPILDRAVRWPINPKDFGDAMERGACGIGCDLGESGHADAVGIHDKECPIRKMDRIVENVLARVKGEK